MSCSRRSFLAFASAAAGLGQLSACGWRPLYGEAGAPAVKGAPIERHLAGIRIEPVRWSRNPSPFDDAGEAVNDSRTGQLLHNALRDLMNPRGQPEEPAYRLEIVLAETIDSVLSTSSDLIRRERVRMAGDFWLRDAKDNDLLKDRARVIASYDIYNDPYSDLSARNDARARLARQLAEEITTRISAFLAAK